jgi:hypothetical protein
MGDIRDVVDDVVPGTKIFLKYQRGSLVIETQITPDGISQWESKPILRYGAVLEPWEAAF